MINIKVKDILKICNGKLIYGSEEIVCENFSKDTRTINKNDVYVGIKGESFDGNLFYKDALKKGAKVCILQDVEIDKEEVKKFNDIAIIKVGDTIKAIQDLAAYKRSLYNIPVIAVTGSVGKTSTKDIIASVMSEKYKVLKTEGNFMYFTYSKAVGSTTYFYMPTMFKGEKGFYLLNFFCLDKDKDANLDKFIAWAKTVEV